MSISQEQLVQILNQFQAQHNEHSQLILQQIQRRQNSQVGQASHLASPKPFDFTKPKELKEWLRYYDRYRCVTGLEEASERKQIDNLVLSLGPTANRELRGIGINVDAHTATYTNIKELLLEFYESKRNPVFDCSRLFSRIQLQNEPIDSFITDLCGLAEEIEEIRGVKEFIVMVKLVSGMRDRKLSKELQRDKTLNLQKAIEAARTREATRLDQQVVRAGFEFQSSMESTHSKNHEEPVAFMAEITKTFYG